MLSVKVQYGSTTVNCVRRISRWLTFGAHRSRGRGHSDTFGGPDMIVSDGRLYHSIVDLTLMFQHIKYNVYLDR